MISRLSRNIRFTDERVRCAIRIETRSITHFDGRGPTPRRARSTLEIRNSFMCESRSGGSFFSDVFARHNDDPSSKWKQIIACSINLRQDFLSESVHCKYQGVVRIGRALVYSSCWGSTTRAAFRKNVQTREMFCTLACHVYVHIGCPRSIRRTE